MLKDTHTNIYMNNKNSTTCPSVIEWINKLNKL